MPALPFFKAAPPPPPPFWQRPATWVAFVVAAVCVVIGRSYMRRRRQGPSTDFSSMYMQLEKSANLSLDGTPASAPPPTAPSVAAVAPPSAPMPAAAPPPLVATPPPATTVPPPAAVPPAMAPPPATSSSAAEPAAEPTTAPVAAPPPAPVAEAADSAGSEEKAGKASDSGPSKKGFSWLRLGQKAKVEPLAELLQSTENEGESNFLRAVASELCIDVPDGCFADVPGLTKIPASVPKGTRTALLHTAVTAEAESLKPVDRAKQIVRVSKAMVTELVDRAAGLTDKEECLAALDNIVGFTCDTQHLCEELAPDVEFGPVTYEGSLRYSKLEDLFDKYLDTSVSEVQAQTTKMMGSLMGGNFDALSNMENMPGMDAMQARIDVCERNRGTLAAVLKISESKAEKLMEKKMTAFAEEAQKEMFAGLKDMKF